jgi:magnesium transporter
MPAKLTKKRGKKRGLPPGTLVYVGEKKVEKGRITLIDYDEAQCQEKEVAKIEECFPFKDTATVTWINIDGLHEVEIIEKIGKDFGIHRLVLEDILNTDQRPKVEDFGKYLFIVLKMLTHDEKKREVSVEQVSLILSPNCVVSFQEHKGDVFDPIRDRIRNAKGRIRQARADYLAYALIDAIVDNYFAVLEKIGEDIELLEQELMANPKPETLYGIHTLKREMIFIRKSVWALREVIAGLERGESPLIKETAGPYLRDVYDHTIQVIDTVESFRDIVSGMLDTYLSSISNRMNQVMQVLTIMASIFIPLTFIAGIYGMNFKFMPELEWPWGYPAALLAMAALAASMLIYFRRKKWL